MNNNRAPDACWHSSLELLQCLKAIGWMPTGVGCAVGIHPLDGSRWLQLAPDDSRWLQVAPESSRWLQMAPGGSRWINPINEHVTVHCACAELLKVPLSNKKFWIRKLIRFHWFFHVFSFDPQKKRKSRKTRKSQNVAKPLYYRQVFEITAISLDVFWTFLGQLRINYLLLMISRVRPSRRTEKKGRSRVIWPINFDW